jgi:uncharacterized protein (TIGR00303 family)
MTLLVVGGTTETATIDGISAAGADPAATYHTPAADLELLEYGDTVFAPSVPVSPSGCPTPAVITRSVRELVGFDLFAVDSGLATPTATPTVTTCQQPGGDIREPEPVPTAEAIFERAQKLGRRLPDDELSVGESIPGGTTTALGVLTALGESFGVSSSLPENPVSLKQDVVATALDASEIQRGELAGNPLDAIRLMGDPVLPAVLGVAVGATETNTSVTLAGGTQMLAAGALLRHLGVEQPLEIATTSFVAADETVEIRDAARRLDLDLTVTDPAFEQGNHVAFERYCRGEAKEGVGMGGALALAARAGVPMHEVRTHIVETYEEVIGSDGF